MGYTKREMERQQDNRREANDICVETGVLLQCEFHPEIVWEHGADPADAYRVANARFQAGELQGDYRDLRDVTDAIKSAIEDSGMDGCPICDKMLAD